MSRLNLCPQPLYGAIFKTSLMATTDVREVLSIFFFFFVLLKVYAEVARPKRAPVWGPSVIAVRPLGQIPTGLRPLTPHRVRHSVTATETSRYSETFAIMVGRDPWGSGRFGLRQR